jgi:hypothetical protein
MGAVGERVAVAAVVRVADLLDAGAAGRGVRYYPGVHLGGIAGDDPKPLRRGSVGQRRSLQGIYPGQRRAFRREQPAELVHRPDVRPDPDQDPLAVVAHVPRKAQPPRDTPHRGPEAHALHQAAHANALAPGTAHGFSHGFPLPPLPIETQLRLRLRTDP